MPSSGSSQKPGGTSGDPAGAGSPPSTPPGGGRGLRRETLAAWLGIATAAISVLAFFGVRNGEQIIDWFTGAAGSSTPSAAPTSTTTPPTSTVTTSASSTPTMSPTPTPTPTPPTPPTTSPPPKPAAVVLWQGSLLFDDGSADPSVVLSYGLDTVPPQPNGTDLSLDCYLVCNQGQLAGNAVVRWHGSAPPGRADCAHLLDTNLGERTADAPPGAVLCFGTKGGRVGYATSEGGTDGHLKVEVTVWDLP